MSGRVAAVVAVAVCALALALALPPAADAAPGDLDASFGVGGVFTGSSPTTFPGWEGWVIDLDGQGRPLVAWTFDDGAARDLDDHKLVVARLTTGGELDATFNPGGPLPGTVVVDFTDAPGSNVDAAGVAAGPGGSVVALGWVDFTTISPQIALVRLTGAGAYDDGFSGDGRLVSDVAAGYRPAPADLAVDASGNALVAGQRLDGCSFQNQICNDTFPFVARFTSSGALDPGWDGDGHWELTGANEGQLRAVAAPAGGGAVAAGNLGSDALAVKLGPTGVPDAGFSQDGLATSALGRGAGQSASGYGVGSDGAGKVLVAGSAITAAGSRAALARFGVDGSPDALWGTGMPETGVVHLPTPRAVRASDVAMLGDGKVLATGHGFTGGQADTNAIIVARLTATGALDAGFAASEPTPGLRQTQSATTRSAGGSLSMPAERPSSPASAASTATRRTTKPSSSVTSAAKGRPTATATACRTLRTTAPARPIPARATSTATARVTPATAMTTTTAIPTLRTTARSTTTPASRTPTATATATPAIPTTTTMAISTPRTTVRSPRTRTSRTPTATATATPATPTTTTTGTSTGRTTARSTTTPANATPTAMAAETPATPTTTRRRSRRPGQLPGQRQPRPAGLRRRRRRRRLRPDPGRPAAPARRRWPAAPARCRPDALFLLEPEQSGQTVCPRASRVRRVPFGGRLRPDRLLPLAVHGQ